MFLGFSLLQLLEYGIAIILTPMRRLHSYLRSRIGGLEPERQIEQQEDKDSETDVTNCTDYHQEVELDQESTWNNCTNVPEEIKVMQQEMRELKIKMDGYVTGNYQRKEIWRNDRNQSKHPGASKPSKIPIRILKHNP